MWSASPKESNGESNNIPALKNFNVYDILEPIKVETVDRNNVKTAKLIDIADEDKETVLIGSYLDKVKKTEFTLIDLLENLYVSPQHVVKNNSNSNAIDFLETPSTDVRFESVNSGNKDKIPKIPDTVQYNKVRTFDEIFDSAVAVYPKLEPVGEIKISEDTIDAVDNIKTLKVESQKSIDEISVHDRATSNGILGKEIISNKEKCDINCKHLNSLHELTNTKNPIEDNFHFYQDHIYKSISQMKLHSLQNTMNEKRNVFEPDSVTRYSNDIKSLLIDENRSPIVPNLNGVAIPILQTIKKDNKAFNKRRVVVKDSVKAGYTKGPNIYEKSIVLPQIIKRLGERKQLLDKKKNIKRKLILDKCNLSDNCSGIDDSRNMNDIQVGLPVLQPEVLMEDCNRERLRALNIRRAFREFNTRGEL